MKVTLIGKNFISSIILPKIVLGNYWLSGNIDGEERKLVNIEGISKNWTIKTSEYLKIIDSKGISFNKDDNRLDLSRPDRIRLIKSEELELYHIYTVCIGNSSEIFSLVCMPVEDQTFTKYEIKTNKPLVIGENVECDIYYKNDYVSDIHACISCKGRKIVYRNYSFSVNERFGNVTFRAEF